MEELHQPQAMHQVQAQERAPQALAPDDLHPRGIDRHPLPVRLVKQRPLENAAPGRRTQGRLRLPRRLLLQVAQVRDDPLPRPPRGPHRFDQRPVRVPLAVLDAIASPQIHVPIVPKAATTRQPTWSSLHRDLRGPALASPRQSRQEKLTEIPTAEVGLRTSCARCWREPKRHQDGGGRLAQRPISGYSWKTSPTGTDGPGTTAKESPGKEGRHPCRANPRLTSRSEH